MRFVLCNIAQSVGGGWMNDRKVGYIDIGVEGWDGGGIMVGRDVY